MHMHNGLAPALLRDWIPTSERIGIAVIIAITPSETTPRKLQLNIAVATITTVITIKYPAQEEKKKKNIENINL